MTKHEPEITNKELAVFISLFAAMLISLILGYFLYKDSNSNCWAKYQTENAAISHCENHNQ
jgi:hypothetical protein